jgi:diaminopropionate ammonia-lyase
MNDPVITYQPNSTDNRHAASLWDFASGEVAAVVARFHQSLPDYQPTPLINLAHLATRLGIESLHVKDESHRFGLNAFKVLGASYAIARYLGKLLGLDDNELTFESIVSRQPEYGATTFVTATDGNHGRAVAWAARIFGCQSVVYLPRGSSPARLKAIQEFGAEAEISHLNYDDTVLHASIVAHEKGGVLLQDTSWPGYEEIPIHIMQGYFTLIAEYIEQEKDAWPTHVFLQAGVGSLAGGILAYLHRVDKRLTPSFIVVEPDEAACLFESVRLRGGAPYKVEGHMPTIMAGLACGEPSLIGLEILKSMATAFLKCPDDIARKGMKILGNPLHGDPAIISGESGAVTLGVVYELLSNKDLEETRVQLGLSASSRILLISTEGDTDPEFYRDTVWS